MNNALNILKNLFSKRKPHIGIELAPERVNITELQKKGQGYKLLHLASAEVPENVMQEGRILDAAQMSEIIQTLLNDNKIKTKSVCTAIPSREAVIRLIPVPAELNDEELRDYMNAEAGLYLPFPRDDADVDYQKLNSFIDEDGIEKVQVVMVATRQEITQTYIDTFEQAGLTIEAIEVNSFALLRSLKDQFQQFGEKEAAVIADIEFDSTELAIVVKGVPQFNRTIPIGLVQIQTALNEAMRLPPTRDVSELLAMTVPLADTMGTSLGSTNPGVNAMLKVLAELTDELRRSIDFYLNQSDELEMSQLLLAGPGAGIGQLDEYFLQRLSLPTSIIDPVESLGLELVEDIPIEKRSGLGVALGLGIGQSMNQVVSTNAAMYSIEINLLKDRPNYKPAEKKTLAPTKGPALDQTPVFIGLGIAAACLGAVGATWFILNQDLQKLLQEQANLDRTLGALDQEVKAIEAIKAEANQINNEADALAGVFNQIKPWSALYAELQSRLPSGVKITSIKQIEPPAPSPTPSPSGPPTPAATPPTAGASPASPTPGAPAPAPAPLAKARVEIIGEANSFGDVNDVLLLLKRSAFFNPINTKLITATEKDNQTKLEFGDNLDAAVQGLDIKLPSVVEYKIETTLSDATAAELLPELKNHGSLGLVNRIESLKQQGVLP